MFEQQGTAQNRFAILARTEVQGDVHQDDDQQEDVAEQTYKKKSGKKKKPTPKRKPKRKRMRKRTKGRWTRREATRRVSTSARLAPLALLARLRYSVPQPPIDLHKYSRKSPAAAAMTSPEVEVEKTKTKKAGKGRTILLLLLLLLGWLPAAVAAEADVAAVAAARVMNRSDAPARFLSGALTDATIKGAVNDALASGDWTHPTYGHISVSSDVMNHADAPVRFLSDGTQYRLSLSFSCTEIRPDFNPSIKTY